MFLANHSPSPAAAMMASSPQALELTQVPSIRSRGSATALPGAVSNAEDTGAQRGSEGSRCPEAHLLGVQAHDGLKQVPASFRL